MKLPKFCGRDGGPKSWKATVPPEKTGKEGLSAGPRLKKFLGGSSKLNTGIVRIGGCSEIVRPENAEVLEAIKSHPRLKSDLESKPPVGDLVIKSGSDPLNFLARCRELGFGVKSL